MLDLQLSCRVVAMDNEMKDPIYYAIGDVHGRADHLSKLLKFIEADARYWDGRPVVYFLGDIVDRGGASLKSLELVYEALAKHPDSALHLGNHDAWFLNAVRSGGRDACVPDWAHFGGTATHLSFYPDLERDDALRAISFNYPHLLKMISNARLITSHGRMVFCHAGVDRFSDIDNQTVHDLTWIRSPFLEIADNKMHVVVHGHTIFEHGPIVTDNRISLDTGCYKNNKLSALRVNPRDRTLGFITTSDSGSRVEVDESNPHLLQRGYGTALDRVDEIFDNWKDAA